MDRRNQPRVQTEGTIRVRILTPGRLEEGYLYDLNNAGAFVATDLQLDRGARIHLELELPGESQPKPLQAIVARCSPEIRGRHRVIPAGLGVAFVANTAQERSLIQQIVMTTLALDLLDYGCSDKQASKTHPRVQAPAVRL